MKSMFTRTTLCSLLGLTLVGACDDVPIDPATGDDPVATPESLGLGDDWTELEPGLWARTDGDGEQNFLGLGEVGRLHVLAGLEIVEDDLLRDLAARDSDETQARLAELDQLIGDLRTSSPPLLPDEVELRCSPTIKVSVDAYPVACGVAAKASDSYSHCSYSGTVWSYAQASCGYNTVTHQCGPKSGQSVACNSQISITGPSACKSKAFAQIVAPGVDIYVWDENTTRGACGSLPPGSPPPDCPFFPQAECQVQ